MTGLLKAPIVLLIFAGLVTASPSQTKRATRAETRAVDPAPSQPVAPMTPEQLPAEPPQVSYLNGQLTIQSENATLAAILSAVRRSTGATIDVPAGSGNERVAAHYGPGPAREVISSLLQGSSFNYVILGSATRPGGIERVILTPRPAGAISQSSPMRQPPIPVQEADTSNAFPEPAASMPPDLVEQTADEPPQEQPEPVAQPWEQQPQVQPQNMPTDTPQSPEQQIKTPQQLLQELQRMQNQRQQPQGQPDQQ